MGSTLAAAVTVALLTGWHLRNRRLPGWTASSTGRCYLISGYAMLAIAVYWLTASPTWTHWEWALGNAWTLAAMVSFVCGFDAFGAAVQQHNTASKSLESLTTERGEAVKSNRNTR
jgi:hypothetical protein